MSVDLAKLKRALACSLLATGLALATGIGSALTAEKPSVDQIIKALTPNLTRSLTTSPAESARNVDETQFLDSLRNRTTRSLTLNEREKIATIAQDKPSIDIDINFEYNSAKLAPSAMSTARTLGEALSSAELKGGTFIVEGHTDAKGGTEFNQRLSERRADAVKRFLVEDYRIPAANLRPVGYGKTKLKNKDNPFGPENRRVRVVNMANNMANK
ncbi:MAG: OmpA family protein [Pseudomonadota bacterium]|nr:OmpA family protein [Pseudomonadota bacterium]